MSGVPRIVWTIGLVAVWSVLGYMASIGWDVFSIDREGIQVLVVGVVAGVGMFLTNYLSPWITQYGIGSHAADGE